MNRREFLKVVAGGGALVATSQLPSFGEDDPAVFARRGKWERLMVGYASVKAGATKPFSVLHISDTHLTAAYGNESTNRQRLARWRTVTFGGRQEEALWDSIAWAKEHADYILHTGDLIDFQSEANYDLARAAFFKAAKGSVPEWYGMHMLALGNHELSPEMWLGEDKCTCDDAWRAKYMPSVAKGFGRDDLSFAATVVNGVNFITLDDVFGTVSAAQVEKFHAEAKKGLPIVLCMHVPFMTDDLWLKTRRYWSNHGRKFRMSLEPVLEGDLRRQRGDRTTSEFIAYLKSERLLKGILAGHEHITMQDRFSPTAMEYLVGGNFMFHGEEVVIG